MGRWSVYHSPPLPAPPRDAQPSSPPTPQLHVGTWAQVASMSHIESGGRARHQGCLHFLHEHPHLWRCIANKNTLWYVERENTEGRKSFSLTLWARCSTFSFGVRSWKLCSPLWPLAPQSLFPYLPHNLEAASPAEQIWHIQPACHQLLENQKCLSYSLLISWYRRASRCSATFDRINIKVHYIHKSILFVCVSIPALEIGSSVPFI